ncbi:MAG: hypothetical protein AB1696_24150 [Planctomycetota bacterium]
MRLQTIFFIVVLISAACFLTMTLIEWHEGKGKQTSPTKTTKAPPPTEPKTPKTSPKRPADLKDLLIAAERAQKLANWQGAAERYQEAQDTLSLSEGEADTVRKKSDAVKDVILAERLVAEEKWDQALLHYQAALDETENRSYVERAITNTGIRKSIADQRAKAEQLAKERKWDEAKAALKEAFRIARAAGISTDIPAELGRLENLSQGIGDRMERMNRAFDVCMGNDNLYGVLALCCHFERDPNYAPERQAVEARKKQASDAIAGRPKDFPSPVAEADAEVVTVKKEGEAEIEGILQEAEGAKLKLSVLAGPRFIQKAIIKTPKVEVKKRLVPVGELNESRARQLLTEAVRSLDRADLMDASAALGCLLHWFPQSETAADKSRQQWLIGAASPRVAAAYGRTLDELIGRMAQDLGDTCASCFGSGLRQCPTCNGTGMQDFKCMLCQGQGAVPCFRCGGNKRVLVNDNMVQCPSCKGTGKSGCAPCQGQGKLPQGCSACDVNHKVKCPDCGGSGRGGRHVEDTISGPQALVKADTPAQRKQRMEWVFDICTSRRDYYAMHAAVRYYEDNNDYKQFADVIAARKAEAESGIREEVKSPKTKKAATGTHDVVTMTDKKRFVGKIAEESDSSLTIAVQQGEKATKRIILKKSILNIERDVADQNDPAQAGDLLNRAAALIQNDRPEEDEKALACIGRMLSEYPDAGPLADAVVAEGRMLRTLLSTAVKRMESLCVDCMGKGRMPCDTCKGAGTRTVSCKWCRGAKRIFCKNCQGCGQEGDAPETLKPCSKCRGTGWTDCPHCAKGGTQIDRCDQCGGAGDVPCKTCGGDGRVDNQPANP